MPTPLADAFVAVSGGEHDREALEALLAARIDEAEFAVDRAKVAGLLGALGKEPLALDAEAIGEVVLALACAGGDAKALARFEERYFAIVAPALAHMKLDAAEVDEVRQIVRDRLFVADGEPARILGYAGRGTLQGLVKVMAVRAALDRVRKRARDAPADELEALPSPANDPELAFLKDKYRAAFAEAFAEAVRALDSRERNLLRLHHLGGVTLDELAKMYGIHRATVVRQLAKVRVTLFRETRRGLQRRLRIGTVELESILGLIQSRFEVSVDGLLRSVETSLREPHTS